MADHLTTRVIAAGRTSFLVRCPTPAARATIQELFADMATADRAPDTTEFVLTETPLDGWGLRADGEDRWTGLPLDWAIAHLITDVNRLALDAEPDRLHLHAAGVAHDGSGVLISAESGTGKTTLTAALLQRGWDYVSDEMISLDVDDPMGRGFPKPLSLQPGGGALLPSAFEVRVPLDADGEKEPWTHIRGGAVAASVTDAIEPAAIVLLHRAADGATDIDRAPVPVHPVDAVVALMGQTMDAERFGPGAVAVLAELAGRCRCAALAVGPPESMAAALEQLAVAPAAPVPVRRLDRPDGFELDGWRVPDHVRSLLIGDRVVVHDTSGGVIVAFDESGTAAWRALHADDPAWWSVEMFAAPATRAFLETLRSHGLLTGSDSAELSAR